jgi:hypothetical protein
MIPKQRASTHHRPPLPGPSRQAAQPSASLYLSRYTRADKTGPLVSPLAANESLDPSEPLSSSPPEGKSARFHTGALRFRSPLSKHGLASATFPTDFWWRCFGADTRCCFAPAQPELPCAALESRREASCRGFGSPTCAGRLAWRAQWSRKGRKFFFMFYSSGYNACVH